MLILLAQDGVKKHCLQSGDCNVQPQLRATGLRAEGHHAGLLLLVQPCPAVSLGCLPCREKATALQDVSLTAPLYK